MVQHGTCLLQDQMIMMEVLNIPLLRFKGVLIIVVRETLVLVGNGSFYENILINKNITLQSLNGMNNTTINGSQSGSVVFITSSSKINGFKIENGLAEDGGGINISSSDVEINNSFITNNYSNDNSAALSVNTSNLAINNSVISYNIGTSTASSVMKSTNSNVEIQNS